MSARALRGGAALLTTLALAGCGDADLWARWQAERALWHAQRAATRVAEQGAHASEAECARVDAALARVMARFPAQRWARGPDVAGPARQVALASGAAALERGRLAAAGGHDSLAAERWREAAEAYAPLATIAHPARELRVDALERLGNFAQAQLERVALAGLDPLGDPDLIAPSREVISAALRAAREWRAEGRADAAAVLLDAPIAACARALERAHAPRSLAIAAALARLRVARGDGPGALAALRRALHDSPGWEAPARAAAMAAAALEAGAPESAFAYVRWASGGGATRRVAGQALLAGAQAWERLGRPDSALATYDQVLRRWVDPGIWGAPAHFARAELLERAGVWESAGAEYRALAAANPTHPLAFLALQRIVRHHLQASEPELARLAGEEGIDQLGRLLVTNADPLVQRQARAVRAELLLLLGRTAEAESSFVDLWQRFPGDSAAQDGALRAAALAEHQAGGKPRAGVLLARLATRAANVTVRNAAAARLAAMPQQP